MQILELEEKYSELKSDLSGQISRRTKLLKISGYLRVALSNPISQLVEPYIVEFIPDFLKSIHDIEIRGLNPELLDSLSEQIQKLKALNLSDIDIAEIEKAVEVLKDKIDLLNDWLNNKNISNKSSKVFFPLLERIDDSFGTGYLESVSLVIKNGEHRFHISPADLENDEQLEKQVQLCFKKAAEYCKQYIKNIKISHTVYLHFENRLGILTGNSLGVALTLSFIEAILKHYNSPIILKINNCVAISGGIDSGSKIISTSKAIIVAKVETVFFSDVQIFCVPKIDEMWAEEKLKHLKENYPNRNLKIVGLSDLNDLLDRRQIVEIKKQPIIKRTGKFVKKNWISAVATVLLAILFAYLFVMDFDDNPNTFRADNRTIFIQNSKGKLLWKRNMELGDYSIGSPSDMRSRILLIDIDNDKKTEVILTGENDGFQKCYDVKCYNYDGSLRWNYFFRDSVYSDREYLSREYSSSIIDTITLNNGLYIALSAANNTSFSSAVYFINIRNAKREYGTFWASGHIVGAIIKDINRDGIRDVLGIGYDNGYEDGVLFGFKIDTYNKVRLTTPEYLIRNYPVANLITYLRVKKTDYDILNGERMPAIGGNSLRYENNDKHYYFGMPFTEYTKSSKIEYSATENFIIDEITIASNFRILRDTLVSHNKLNLPYTDTEEYKNIIMDNVLSYKEGKWVNRKGEVKE